MKKREANDGVSTRKMGGWTRRKFVGATAAGIAGILTSRTPPAFAQKRELSILSWNHFVPASDEKLREQAATFSREQGVSVKVDTIAHRDLPAKLAAEAQTGAGHDMVFLTGIEPAMYKDKLADVDSFAEELGRKYGGYQDLARQGCILGGHWKAVPWFYLDMPGTYREDYFAEVGEKTPETYDDLLRAGRKLKKAGHPVGIAISHTPDSTESMLTVMYGFGAKIAEPDGKTVAINSSATRDAVSYVQALFREAMEPEVLAWDDASNNRFMLSGKGSWTYNGISIYVVAKRDVPEIAKQLNHHLPLRGPGGQHGNARLQSFGIWKFARNAELARDFLRFHFEEKQYNEWIQASVGYNHPLLKQYEAHPVWRNDPKLAMMADYGRTAHIYGWPAPPDERIQLIVQMYIIPDMFAKAVTGTPVQEAVTWAEREIRKIYDRS